MKRSNRFSRMVPPTPEDFHASVADALNRLDSAPKHSSMQNSMVRIAASVAVVIALGACLMIALQHRSTPEDRMASPVDSLPTVAPEVQEETPVHLEFGQWSVDDQSCELTFDWTLTGPEDETLLVCGDGTVLSGGLGYRDAYVYMLDYSGPVYALLGKDVLGYGNGSVIEATGIASDFMWEGMVDPMLLLRVDVYRPLCEFIDDREVQPEAFEGQPKWLLARMESHMEAMPIDYYGRYEYQTPYGSDWMQQLLADYSNANFNREPGDQAAELDHLREGSELRSILLQTYGFAEPVASYRVVIDMSAGSGSGATEIIEIVP